MIPPAPMVHVLPLGQQPLDPLSLLHHPTARREPRFFWSAPDTGLQIAAFGAIDTVAAGGPGRLAAVGSAIRSTLASSKIPPDSTVDPTSLGHDSEPIAGCRWIGGFGFFDAMSLDAESDWLNFPPARFTLPRVTLSHEPTGWQLTVIGRPSEDSTAVLAEAEELASWIRCWPEKTDATERHAKPLVAGRLEPTHAERQALEERIARGILAIEEGKVRKVVLATSHRVPLHRAADPLHVLSALRGAQPDCFHFLVNPRPGVAFVGATPERLVRVEGNRLFTMALAGSTSRSADPDEDARLGAALLQSAKDRSEHALVVQAISDLFGDHALTIPEAPRLMRLATIQHLETPIEALLAGQGNILAEAMRLHPTPALGGSPREAALKVIQSVEGIERGWYGGGIGWVDPAGNGDIAVGIRAILLRSEQAIGFAGAGIVAGSIAGAEAEEIAMKLRSALGVLGADSNYGLR